MKPCVEKLPNTTNTASSMLIKGILLSLALWAIISTLSLGVPDEPGEGNLYIHQARAFLNGRLDLDKQYHDVAVYNERYYCPFPPFPAVLLLPFVAFFDLTSSNITFISLALTILSAIMMVRIFDKLEINSNYIRWLTAAFIFGTGYWLCVSRGSYGVWHFAHIVSVTCLFFAINEVFGRNRGIITGMFLGLSFLSRQLTIFAIFFLFVAMLHNLNPQSNRKKIANIAAFAFAVALCVSVYLAFNWLRFGNIFDTGYSYINLKGFLELRRESFGKFSLFYVPFNFINMFVQGFHMDFKGGFYMWDMKMDRFGTSLTFASPFIFVALRALSQKKKLILSAWVSICLMLICMLLYYNNGYSQVNAQRFTLDFMPILIVLVALGTKRFPESIWKTAVAYSIFLNFLALFLIPLIVNVVNMMVDKSKFLVPV